MKGVVREDPDGKIICEICGKSFHRLLTHVRQKHGITAKEYKLRFGLDNRKGICSTESSLRSRDKVLSNPTIIQENLIKGGSKNRFKEGSKGRTKDKVSEQTRIMLKNRLKSDCMVEAMRESGRKVGLSGLGNKKRWSNQ